MKITDDHLEYAVIKRYKEMLTSLPESPYSVSLTYALFTTTLCWTIQRIRSTDSGANDDLAREVLEELESSRIEDHPWRPSREKADSGDYDNRERNAATLLIALRNAVAHGDGRKVVPINRDSSLVGFSFETVERPTRSCKRTIWRGRVELISKNMKEIRMKLSDIFCETMQRFNHQFESNQFDRDALSIKEPSPRRITWSMTTSAP